MEANKIAILGAPGKDTKSNDNCHKLPMLDHQYSVDVANNFVHSAVVDELYTLVALHVDEASIRKIHDHEYVDFAKLVPRDRVLAEDEVKLEMVMRGGKTYWTTVQDNLTISSFARWEQAFQAFLIFIHVFIQKEPQCLFNIITSSTWHPTPISGTMSICMTRILGFIYLDILKEAGPLYYNKLGQSG